MMCNEQAYSLAVEKLLNIQAPPRAQWIRGTEHEWSNMKTPEEKIFKKTLFWKSYLTTINAKFAFYKLLQFVIIYKFLYYYNFLFNYNVVCTYVLISTYL